MRKSEINFPHPLLSDYSKDYSADCTFSIELGEVGETSHAFLFPFSYSITSLGLKEMIANNHAVVVVRAYCSYTSYREIFKFKSDEPLIVEIPKGSVSKKIELQGTVVAAVDNQSFSLPEHNQNFFAGTTVVIKKGNILAEFDPIQINIDDSELEKQLSSIIVIDSTTGIECLDVNYNDCEDGLIHIRMPEEEYQEYFTLRKNYNRYGISRFLQSAVIMPALTEAISLLRMEAIQKEVDPEFEEKYGTTVWADSIYGRCEELHRDISDHSVSAYCLANEILHFVTKDAVTELHKKAQEMFNNNGATRIGGVD